MQRIVTQVHKSLLKKRKTIAVAESCTGGKVSSLLTQLPGSSKYFILGVVVYSNKAKESILKVPLPVVSKYGAISEQTASLLAQNIRKLAKTDFGIGITGIAGPTGATLQKPVGTVFIAIDSQNKKICQNFCFSGNRSAVRRKAALKALKLLENIF